MLRAAIVTASFTFTVAAQAGTVTSDGPDLVIKTKGGLQVSTTDKQYSFKVGGRIQYDYDKTETQAVGASSSTVTDDFDVRRARLFVSGKIQDWSFKSQFNVDAGGAEDLYIRYNGFGSKAKVTVGKQKMPFGLEELTSSKDISFLERNAATESYAIGRAEGVQLSGKNGNFTYAIAGYDIGDATDGSDDFGIAARATFAAVKTDDTVVHLGFAYKDVSGGVSTYALEAAAVVGAFHAQAEFFDQDNGTAAADTDAYYAQVGWVITGEQRPYKGGKFKRIKPKKGAECGAFEVVARYTDGDAKYSDVGLATTDGSEWGLGFNWYVNNAVKLGLSYASGEEEMSGTDGEEIRGRLQLVF